jgi:hypothetical protein
MSIRAFFVVGFTVVLLAGCGTPLRPNMNAKPELRQFGTLKPADFMRHPVWVQCHTIDYDESWYDRTDEETFRPWAGALPVEPQHAMFLVRATFTLADGTTMSGFVTPSATLDWGVMQPCVFSASGRRVAFWHGAFPRTEEREAAYEAFGRTASEVFPMRFTADRRLSSGITSGTLEGFYAILGGSKGKVSVEK